MSTTNRLPRARRRRGALTLEWILLVTILAIGIIAGLGAVRSATIAELQDLAGAIRAINMGPCADCDCCGNDPVPIDDTGGGGGGGGGHGGGSGDDDNNHGNNGVGNGQDPQPPGNPPINDGDGTGPGNPG